MNYAAWYRHRENTLAAPEAEDPYLRTIAQKVIDASPDDVELSAQRRSRSIAVGPRWGPGTETHILGTGLVSGAADPVGRGRVAHDIDPSAFACLLHVVAEGR